MAARKSTQKKRTTSKATRARSGAPAVADAATAFEPTANITLIFQGLMIVSVDRKTSNRKQHCEVAILDNAPGHNLVVIVARQDGDIWVPIDTFTKPQIKPLFWLDVEGPGDGVIDFRANFDQVVDFDSADFYNKDVKINEAGIYSTFHVNNGTFYMADESEDELYRRKGPDSAPEPYRKVATAIGVDINLLPGRKALFVNGDRHHVFEATEKHAVIISQSPPPADPSPALHAELYYPTVAGEKRPRDRWHFHRPPGSPGHTHGGARPMAGLSVAAATFAGLRPRVPPHAICFTGTMGDGPASPAEE